MKNEKKVMLLSLTILAVLLTGFTWAYWNSGKIEAANVKAESNTIQIGTGSTETVVTNVDVISRAGENSQGLVPKKYSEENSKAELVFDLGWNTDVDSIGNTIAMVKITNLNLKLDDNRGFTDSEVKDALNDMFEVKTRVEDVHGTEDKIAIKSSTQLYITVEFKDEPYSKEVYDLIQSNNLKLLFEVGLELE